jgi:hypothetical protein
VNYLTYPEDFAPSDEDPLEDHILGYLFNVTLEFRVTDDAFFNNPGLCIYVRTPEDQYERILIDSTMMWSKCENCLAVEFQVFVGGPGWLGCYCFPSDYEIYQPSLEQVGRSNIHREVYLRLPE